MVVYCHFKNVVYEKKIIKMNNYCDFRTNLLHLYSIALWQSQNTTCLSDQASIININGIIFFFSETFKRLEFLCSNLL